MLFQSLAPQHRLGSALKHLFIIGKYTSRVSLEEVLRQRYSGHTVQLYSRGRAALAEAIRVATNDSKTGSVAITGYTCFSVEQAVIAAGLKPIYLDINPDTIHFGGSELSKALKSHKDIKAVVVQNNLGVPADMKSIEKFTKEHKIAIVEDLAHSAGTSYADGREAGTVGDVTMLSFGKGKAIDTVNGGAVVVRNATLKVKPTKPVLRVRFKDSFRDRIYPFLGVIIRGLFKVYVGKYLLAASYKLRLMVRSADGEVDTNRGLSKWQARLALEQLLNLDSEVANRQLIAKKVFDAFKVSFVQSSREDNASLVRIPFLVKNREEVLASLKRADIFIEDVWYDSPLSPLRYQKRSLIKTEDLPKSVKITSAVVNFPTHRNVKDSDIKIAARVINEVTK